MPNPLPNPRRGRKRLAVLLAAGGLLASTVATTGASAEERPADHGHSQQAYVQRVAPTPYMGWSSWSLQSSHYPGVNTKGNYSWLDEQHVLAQADVMAAKLKSHGYEYINVDAGWWMDWSWNPNYDANGRQTADPVRFPHGMKYVADYVHAKGLKFGIYLPVGLEKGSYAKGDLPIAGAPGCSTHQIVYPDLRTTNGWDSAYKIDFSKPCAQAYIDSLADMFAGWGVDFLKLDGVGPGSDKSGANHDNQPDVRAWSRALAGTHRPIQLVLSWTLNHDYVTTWKQNSNGWRIDTDVECYCNTLVQWNRSVSRRWDDVVPWIADAGKGGWNNLDSVDVGNGAMDGITPDERQSVMTFWAIEAAPLYSGDDLTTLDDYGLKLLTNDEVIAIDQAGVPAHPVLAHQPQQVWFAQNHDGSYTVALFNMSSSPATVTASWPDLGLTGPAAVHDVWSHQDLGTADGSFSATLAPHASRLLKLYPRGEGRA